MDALTNAHIRRGGKKPPRNRLTSITTPQYSNFNTGVTSDYASKENHKWFVFRATYNQVKKAFKALIKQDITMYIPMHYVVEVKDGKKEHKLKQLLPNIIFVYITREQADSLVKKPSETSDFLKYYLDKTQKKEISGLHPPLIIKESEMRNFIHTTSINNDHIMKVTPEYCHFKTGDIIKIIDGDFKGVIGRVARVAGQQRVVVEIKGLCMIATAYIPNAFIKRV